MLTPLNETATEATKRRVSRVVQLGADGRFTLVKRPGWVAVPVESSGFFSRPFAERLSSLIGSETVLHAVSMEMLEGLPSAYSLENTSRDIYSLNRSTPPFSFVLSTKDLPWLIISPRDDYFVVVGPETFVENVTKESIESSFTKFWNSIKFYEELPQVPVVLRSVHNVLADIYPNALDNTWVRFPEISFRDTEEPVARLDTA